MEFFSQLELTGKTGELDELLGGEHKTNVTVKYHQEVKNRAGEGIWSWDCNQTRQITVYIILRIECEALWSAPELDRQPENHSVMLQEVL